MRKILIILLCLPLFVFSQEEKKYERTMSFSQFAEELENAANKDLDYILESCDITCDTIKDKRHLTYGVKLRPGVGWYTYKTFNSV